MQRHHFPWLLIAIALFGVLVGFLLSNNRSFLNREASELPEQESANSDPVERVLDFSEPGQLEQGALDIDFPRNSVGGEFLISFTDESEYFAYLALLANAGYQPLGRIDELLVVRIPEEALAHGNLGDYGAEAGFTYIVERPLPPVEIDPAALSSLRAYGVSARSIVGGLLDGSGQGVLIAILDSGIEAHPQFDDVRIMDVDLAGGGVSGKGSEHGTSVASIISGSEGIVPNAELLVVRVLDDEGMGNSFHVAEGIVRAVDLGAKVINLSLGVYQDSAVLRQAVKYASDRDVLLVAAAGNDAYNQLPYPAAYPEVISVTAVDANGRQALFPNQSDKIDFAAPGVGVLAAEDDESTVMFSGTSAAAPFVTGTLASLISGENPLSSSEALSLMRRYLNDSGAPGTDAVYGDGVVDWTRLRERNVPDIIDVALADIYLKADALPGTTMPIQIVVQNRGTRWINDAELEVKVGESDPVSFTLGSIDSGQITTREVYTQVPALNSEETLTLAARVLVEDVNSDLRLENNAKAMSYTPIQ